MGRDSSFVRLIARAANSCRMRAASPAGSARWKQTIDVLSWPVAAGTPRPTITNRVCVLGMVLDLLGDHVEPVELGGETGADRRQPFRARAATRSARLAVEFAASSGTPGSFALSQRRHWAIAYGSETTVRTSASCVPGRANRCSETGRSISRWIRRSVSNASVSSVTVIEPSIEFSMGTMPRSTSPRSTAAMHVGERRAGDELRPGEIGLRQERLLGERAGRAEEGDAGHLRSAQ